MCVIDIAPEACMRVMHRCRSILPVLPALLLACGDGETPPGPTEPDRAPVPTSMAITPSSVTLAAFGQTVQLTATVRDQGGQPMAGVPVNWASSDAGVVTVDAAGVVMAVDNGSTNVTATVRGGGASAAATVTVAQRVAELRLSPIPEVFRALGDTLRMSAGALDASGNMVTGIEVAWSSTDESVVTVDATGLVTAVGNGHARVDVMVASRSADAEFRVEQQATAIQVSPAADTLRWLGDTLQLSAEAFDANRYVVGSADFSWSSSDESVATVDATGLVTAEGVGTVEITAAVAGSDITDTATLQVEALPARDVLIALYNATDGPNWKNSENWLTDAPLGSWHGIRTDYRDETMVRAIDLHDNGLNGRLPPELGNILSLTRLAMTGNEQLAGPIPPELGHLVSLVDLVLKYNELSGPIPPELGDFANLKILNLWNNSLTGSIPPELARLAGLSELWLANNELTGPIPTEFGGMAGLREMMLEGNKLSGAIPPEFAGLKAVEGLRLGANELTGSIPPALGALPAVQTLSLWGNKLSGSIPPEIGNLPNVSYIALGQNELEGAVPAEFGNLVSLRVLLLGKNKLSGSIPPELGDLGGLRVLALMENALTGSIPPEVAGLTKLEELYIQDNQGLTGSIPQEFVNLRLDEFWWYRTQLCAPANQAFQAWLSTVGQNLGAGTCAAGAP